MVYRNKGKFILNEQCLQKIVNNIMKQPQNHDIAIEIIKSCNVNSKSLYLRFCIGDCTTLLRISDHKCKGEVRNILVGESTGISNIYYKIDSAIRDLRFKRLNGLLNKGA